MAISFTRFATLAGAAALAAAALHAAPAAAQQAKYCNNALVANSFYANTLQAQGGGAEVEYHGQFQNQDPQRRAMTATMLRAQKILNFTILRPVARIELNSYEQKDIVVFAVHTNNQSGQGAPTPQQVSQTIRFTCTFR